MPSHPPLSTQHYRNPRLQGKIDTKLGTDFAVQRPCRSRPRPRAGCPRNGGRKPRRAGGRSRRPRRTGRAGAASGPQGRRPHRAGRGAAGRLRLRWAAGRMAAERGHEAPSAGGLDARRNGGRAGSAGVGAGGPPDGLGRVAGCGDRPGPRAGLGAGAAVSGPAPSERAERTTRCGSPVSGKWASFEPLAVSVRL